MAYVEITSLTKELKKRTVLNDISISFEQGKDIWAVREEWMWKDHASAGDRWD